MANYIEITNLNPLSFVPVSSRYADSTIVYYTENNLITFTIYKRQPITTSPSDRYAVISAGSEYRPDKVSQTVYGTPDFWWKIMEANQIWDIFDFKAGLNIRLPNALLG